MFVNTLSQINGTKTNFQALIADTKLNWESSGFNATVTWTCTKAYDIDENWTKRLIQCESNEEKGI